MSDDQFNNKEYILQMKENIERQFSDFKFVNDEQHREIKQMIGDFIKSADAKYAPNNNFKVLEGRFYKLVYLVILTLMGIVGYLLKFGFEHFSSKL